MSYKNNRPRLRNSSFADSKELFEDLFRNELDALTEGGLKPARPETGAKARKAVKKESLSQRKAEVAKKIEGRPGGKTPRIEKETAGSDFDDDKAEPVEMVKGEKRFLPFGLDKLRKAKRKGGIKAWKTKEEKIGPRAGPANGSNTLKIALLCVLWLALVGALLTYFGLVDLGKFIGFSRSPAKGRAQPVVAKALPSKQAAKGVTPPHRQKQSRQTRRRANVVRTKRRLRTVKPRHLRRTASLPQARQSVSAKKIPAARDSSKSLASQVRPLAIIKPHKPTASQTKPKAPTKTHETTLAQVRKPSPPKKKAPTPKGSSNLTTARSTTVALKRPTKSGSPAKKRETVGTEELFPEEKALSYPYSIHLGSYNALQRAKKAVAELQKEGLSPYWVKVDLGEKGTWYRIFLGHFEDLKKVKAFLSNKHFEYAKAKKTKYAALIGPFTAKDELQRKSLALSRLGYSPYVISQNNGESLLYVGAFYTRIGAEKLHAELISKGVQNRVVER